MFSTVVRFVTVTVTATVLASALTACGTGATLGKIRPQGTTAATKKDCAACKKMCDVGGSNEGNTDAVSACKKDCEKSCQ